MLIVFLSLPSRMPYLSENSLQFLQQAMTLSVGFWLVILKYVERAQTAFHTRTSRIGQFSWIECLKLQRAAILSVNL